MVRETRYLWVGNIPDKVSEDDLTRHFQRYGKIQSVKFVVEDGSQAAVVAFMDIKSASKAHGAENKIDGKLVETQYSEASGRGSKVTRTTFESEPSTRANIPSSSRYEGSKPGYDGYNYGSYYGSSAPGRPEDGAPGERWQPQESPGAEYYPGERGRPRQRYPPQPPEYYKQKSYEGHYSGAYEKYSGPPTAGGPPRPPRAGQSPGMSEASSGKVKMPPKSYQQSRSRSRSRSSSSSSSGSHSTSTSRSRRSSSKASKERKRSSVVVQPHRKPHPAEDTKGVGGGKLGLLLRGFPPRSSDTSIRDGLFHEYKKCGKVMSVSITGEKEDRYAIVTFKKTEDASKALEQARARVFFGRKVEAEPHDGIDDSLADYRPPEAELDEYHHKATRTLFVGNLQTDISKEQLKEIFRRYGLILDIDIKNQQPNQVFAFVQYDNIKSVVAALHEMDGETVGNSKVKLGFGRSMPTNVLWVDNITEQVQENYLKRQFSRAAAVNYVLIDRDTGRALVFYDSNELAVVTLSALRGRAIASKKIQIDFASTACMNALMDNMEATGQLRPEDRPDQKGFRQYPPPTHAPEGSYEERQGYDRSSGKQYYYDKSSYRGRGGFRGAPGYSRGGRTYYQGGGYDENYKQKRYDEAYSEDPAKYGGVSEDYERELHDYKTYKSKEGPEGGSSPYTRGSERYEEYSGKEELNEGPPRSGERYKDADNQSGDRESMRSHPTEPKATRDKYDKYSEDKMLKDKLVEEKRKEKVRGYSPDSDYGGRRTAQRSPSVSPPRGRKTSKDIRVKSPSSPARFSSPEIASPKKGLKSKIEANLPPSTTLISEIQRTRPRKHTLKRESETDLSELDRALLKADLFESPPKKRQAIEEQIERSRKEAEANLEYRQKLEREHALRRSSSGSHSVEYSGAIVENYRDVRTKGDSFSVHLDNRIPPAFGGEGEFESKFSTPSPSTKSNKSESDKTPDSSERHSSGHSSGEMDILEKEKLRLLNELKDMEDNGSVSDGEIREDEESKEKKPRLEEVFDLEWSPSECSMKKWREKAKKLEREKQMLEGQENKEPHPKNAHTEPPPKPPEPPGTGEGGNKFKPIDTKKSLRKQMEAMRKEQDKDTAHTISSRDSKNGEGPRESHKKTTQGPEMDIDEENSMDTSTKSSSKSEFRKKKGSSSNSNDFPKVKGQRSYRNTRNEDGLSSGDEHNVKDKSKDSVRKDTSKSRRVSDVDKVGKSPSSANRRESTDSKQSNSHEPERESSTRSRHDSKDSRESSNSRTRKDSQSSRRDRSGDSSTRKSVRDLRTEPCIIPDFTIETKDSKHGKVVPTDPRKKTDKQNLAPLSFPLPKFASKFLKKGSPKQASKSRSSPKGQDSSISSKFASPLFSPDISPASSKSKGDRLSRKDSFEKSQENSMDSSSQKDNDKTTDKKEVNKIKTETILAKEDTHVFEDIKTAILDDIKFESNDNKTETEKDTSEKVAKSEVVDNKQSVSSLDNESVSSLDKIDTKTEVSRDTDIDKLQTHDAKTVMSDEKEEKLDTSEHEPMDTSETTVLCDKVVPNTNCATVSTPDLKSIDESIKDTMPEKETEKVTNESSIENKCSSGSDSNERKEDKPKSETNEAEPEVPSSKDLSTTPVKSETEVSPNKEKHTSDSDLSDLDNSASQSLDERIRALDEKLEQASCVDVRRTPTDSPSAPSTPTLSATPYRERFRVRKRGDSNATAGGSLSAVGAVQTVSDNKGEPSDYVKSLLSTSSIFDQDSKRLEQIDEKYQPKEYNLNLDRPTGSVGGNSDQEDEDFESRVKEYYGLSDTKAPTFPSAILRNQLSAGGPCMENENSCNASDAFGLGPALTFAPPGSLANQDKFGPQTLSRYPFLAKKPSFDLSKGSPPQPGTPLTVTTPEGLRSPPMLPRDPRRDPLSPPLVMPMSILKKSPVTTPINTSPGLSSISPLSTLSSPPGILRKTEPGPSILKKADSGSSIMKKTESTESLTFNEDSCKSDIQNSSSVNNSKSNESFQDSNTTKKELFPKVETKETNKSKNKVGSHPLEDTHTPSGTGNTAVSSQHIEPENSAVPKNELSSGDGVQYQSTPSPPVLINEIKAQGIGTKNSSTSSSIKRTASQAFDEEKFEKDLNDSASPPHLTTESEPISSSKETEEQDADVKRSCSPKVPEPEAKKAKTLPESKKEKKPISTKSVMKEVKKVTSGNSASKTSSKTEKKAENSKKSVETEKKLNEKKAADSKPPSSVKPGSSGDKKSVEKSNSSSDSSDKSTISDSKKVSKSSSVDKSSGSSKKGSSSASTGKTSGSSINSSSSERNSKSNDKASSDRKVFEKSKSTDSTVPDKKQSANADKTSEKKSSDRKSPPSGSERTSVDKKVNEKKSLSSSNDKKLASIDKKVEKSSSEKKVSDGKQNISTEKKPDKSDSEKKSTSSTTEKKSTDRAGSGDNKSKKLIESKSKDGGKQSDKPRHHSSASSVSSTKSSSSSVSTTKPSSSSSSKTSESKKESSSISSSSKKESSGVLSSKSSSSSKDVKKDSLKYTKDSAKAQKGDESGQKSEKKQSPQTESKSKPNEDNVSKSSNKVSGDSKTKEQKNSSNSSSESKSKSDNRPEKLPMLEKTVKSEEKKPELNKSEKVSKDNKTEKVSKAEPKDLKIEKNENIDKSETKSNKPEKAEKNDKYSKSDKTSSSKYEKSGKESKNKDKPFQSSKEKSKEGSSKNEEKLHKYDKQKQNHSDSRSKQKSSSERRSDESKVRNSSDKKDSMRNNKRNDRISEKQKQRSPVDRKQRSDSMTGETRELKQLRESLGIDADGMLNGEPIQFFSMYDMVKRRTHKEVSKEETKADERSHYKNSRRRSKRSDDSDDSNSDSDDDSAFSSENKENKKNLSKSKVSNRKFIMSSSSDDFSSDDSDGTGSKKKVKSPPSSNKKVTPTSKKKAFISSSSDQSSDSSSESSDDEKQGSASKKKIQLTPPPPPKAFAKKKVQKSVESNSSSSGSDSDVKPPVSSKPAAVKKQTQAKPIIPSSSAKTKTNTESKMKSPAKKTTTKKVQSSSSSSSSNSSSDDSDSDSSDQHVKTPKNNNKKKTALEKLESIFDASNSDHSSSDDDVVTPPPKIDKKPSPVSKKKPVGLFSDSDEQNAINKFKAAQNKTGKVSKAKKFISSSSESSGSSSQSDSSSDAEQFTKNKISKSPSKDIRRPSSEGSQKGVGRKEPSVDLKDKKKVLNKVTEKKSQETPSEKRPKNNSPVRKQSPKEASKPATKMVSVKSKEVQNDKLTKPEKKAETVPKESQLESSNKGKNRDSGESSNELKKIDQSKRKSKDEKPKVVEKVEKKPDSDSSSSSSSSSDEEEQPLNITEEEKGMEEKANKMQSIFKHTDNIFEKMELENDISPGGTPSGSDGRDQSSQCSGDEGENLPSLKAVVQPEKRASPPQKVHKEVNKASKLFDTSDSESEVDVKLQTEKILQQQEDSQDSELNIPSTPDIDDNSQDCDKETDIAQVLKAVETIQEKPKTSLTESPQDEEKLIKKPESPKSEPVQNTVVETEKAVKSLEKLWEEPTAPTIVETGIVANVEIQSEVIEEPEKPEEPKEVMVAEDEVANAILSICGIGENETVSVISDPQLAASIAAEAGQSDVEGNVVYQIEDNSSEAQQAVAALVFGNDETYNDEDQNVTEEATTELAVSIENEIPVIDKEFVEPPPEPALAPIEELPKELKSVDITADERTEKVESSKDPLPNGDEIRNTRNEPEKLFGNYASSELVKPFEPEPVRSSVKVDDLKQSFTSPTTTNHRRSSFDVDPFVVKPSLPDDNKPSVDIEPFVIAPLIPPPASTEKSFDIDPFIVKQNFSNVPSMKHFDNNVASIKPFETSVTNIKTFDTDPFMVKSDAPIIKNTKENNFEIDHFVAAPLIDKTKKSKPIPAEPIVIKPIGIAESKTAQANAVETIRNNINKTMNHVKPQEKKETPVKKPVDLFASPESKEIKPSKYISELLANPNRIQDFIDADKPKPVKQRSVEPVQIPSFERLVSLPSKTDSLMSPLSVSHAQPYFAERKDEFPHYIPPSFTLVPKDNVQKQKVPAPTIITKPVEHTIESMVNPQNLEQLQPHSYRHVMPQQPFEHNMMKPMMSPKIACPKPQIINHIEQRHDKHKNTDFNPFDIMKTQTFNFSSPESSNIDKPLGISTFNHNNQQHSPKGSQQTNEQTLQKITSPKNNFHDLEDLIQKVNNLKEQTLKQQEEQNDRGSQISPSEKEKGLEEKPTLNDKSREITEGHHFSDKDSTDLKTYEPRTSYNMFNSPEPDELGTPTTHESDTDREKDDDEQKDQNIVYEKEPEKEAIPIDELNDFEDEEDLPDLIIDESSPIGSSKNTAEDDEENDLSIDDKQQEGDVSQENITKPPVQQHFNNSESMKQKENIPEVLPIQQQEIAAVSLKDDEELEGGVLHIVEGDNHPQATITLSPNKVLPTQPVTPKSKRKAKANRRTKKVNAGQIIAAPMKTLQDTPAQNFTPQVVAPMNVKLTSPNAEVDLIKSPVTRRKAKQEDGPVSNSTVSPPTTRTRAGNGETPEKFSSRGRKIIPKDRGDEVSTLTRRGRRNASANNVDDAKGGVRKVEEPGEQSQDGSETGGKKKTWPLRNRKESEVESKEETPVENTVNEVLAVEQEPVPEPPKECGPIKITLRRTPRGRKATIQKTVPGEATPAPDVYTNVTENDTAVKPAVAEPAVQEPPTPAVSAVATPIQLPAAEENVRTRRSRRAAKGRKSSDTTSPATRARKNDGSSSPRSKSTEATSPKELAKSYVKLEKLNIDQQSAMKKDEDDQKDLYEWNDEEDKPLLEYKVARAARKRKSNEAGSSESPQKAETEVVEPIKRTKKSKAAAELKKEKEQKKEAKQTAAVETKVVPPVKVIVAPPQQPEKVEPVPEKKEPEPRKPDMNDILQGQRGHLPLKLAMKWESQEAARKEREAKEAAEKAAVEKAAHEAQKLAEQQKNKTGIVSDHLDKVIEEVARGHFEKSEEARIIDKKRGRFNREDQFSPGVQDLSRSAVSGAPPVVLSPHITSQVGHRLTPPSSRPPSTPGTSIQTGVVSTGAMGMAPGDGSQGQSIVRVPNPHSHADPLHNVPETFARPSIQSSIAKPLSSQLPQKGITSMAKHDNNQQMPITVAVPPMMTAAQAALASPSQLSPHSVRGQSPRVQPIPGFPQQHYQHPGMPPQPPTQISPTQQSQGSELRQVLSQPSKLVQQEQLLQQQRLQDRHVLQQPQLSPHLPDPKQSSPTVPGQLRIPFSMPDQRTTTRSDPKGTVNVAGQGPITVAHGSRPEGVFPSPAEIALAHPELRNGLPPGQMLLQGIPGVPPHMVPYLSRSMPVDPRVLQFHHEQIAAQQMLGMLPPHHPQAAAMVNQHQPPVADRHPHDQSSTGGRPPSRHPTPPTAQPSPRGTPHHHSPQVSTPLTPQLPVPPMAALPGLSTGRQPPIAHMSSNGMQPVGIPPDGMIMAVHQYPLVWQGYLYLKNDVSSVQMHFVTGNRALISGALDGATDGGIVRIAQRMRLEPTQLEGVAKRMQKDDEFSMLVAVPYGKDPLDFMHQTNKLQTGFIQYLQQKQAAGIVNIPNPIQPGYVVHIFPPCDFSSRNISQKAPELTRCLGDMSYLVVVITST